MAAFWARLAACEQLLNRYRLEILSLRQYVRTLEQQLAEKWGGA